MGDEAKKSFGQFISPGSAGKVAETNAISALTGSDAPLSGMAYQKAVFSEIGAGIGSSGAGTLRQIG